MNAFTKMLEEGERMPEEPPQFNGGTNKKGQQMMATQMLGQSQANAKRTAGVGRTKNRTELRETADATANRLANATKSGEC